jgi:hypothetical protein
LPKVDDIVATGKADVQAKENLSELNLQFRRFMRDEMTRMGANAFAYANKRVHSKSRSEPILRKVLKDATFIPAHPTRFQAGGYNVEQTKYFVLHRPGREPKAARVDNIIREFVNENRKASTHFIIGQNGALIQMVDLGDIAYHCGGSRPAINSNSVGVELEGAVGEPVSSAMMYALSKLVATIHLMSGMPLDDAHILHHYEILPKQKVDAGVPVNAGRVALEAQALASSGKISTDFYQPPFDPRESVSGIASSISALAAAPGTTQLMRGAYFASAATVGTLSRSIGLSATARENIAQQAAQQMTQKQLQTARDLASKLSVEDTQSQVTPQTNTKGVLFDPTTGLYNDGKTQ